MMNYSFNIYNNGDLLEVVSNAGKLGLTMYILTLQI